jgi:DNA gyrase subunit A
MVENTPTGRIVHRVIEQEMKQAYVDYAMSVIVGRALPDSRDGLKPVHRRILFAMHDSGLLHNKPFKKSAHIVGKVLAEMHPHGDLSVYDALVRMAQDFSLRYPLINGQGNWGSIDGDNAAAYRYTEARLNKLAEQLLEDIGKATVNFKSNFDDSTKEPEVLPSKIPNLLINGSTGIAVGMTTNIPPHNLREVCSAINVLIDNPDVGIDKLMELIPGPDFPTGATIVGREGIEQAYKGGRGKVTVKAVTSLEDNNIIITEIPYMVNKSQMIEEMANLVRIKKVEGIKNIRDESDRDGIRVVIELKTGASSDVILNQLYKYSRMKTTFGIIFLALVNNEPKLLNLKSALQHFLNHRREVVRRRTQHELNKAEERAHILEGIITALDNVEKVISGIRASNTIDDAKKFLIDSLSLSEIQAKAILDMRLQKLASLEQENIRLEHDELTIKITEYKEILASEQKISEIIKSETNAMKEEFGDIRRTQIISEEDEALDVEQLIEDKEMAVTISHAGYIKRIPLDTYRNQRRGGRGVTAATSKEEDWIEDLFVASTHSHMLLFTNQGQVHWLKVFEIPEGGRLAKGRPIINLVSLAQNEKITAYVPVKTFDSEHNVFMATRNGTVKKTPLSAFSRPRRGGIRSVTLDEGDELIGVQLTDNKKHMLLATKNGLALRFNENDVRPMGRTATGVKGMSLSKEDSVVSLEIADESKTILTVTSNGYGKRTNISDYRLVGRGGKGVINMNLNEKTGKVTGVKTVTKDDELMFISRNGIAIRTPAKDISLIGRATQGVRVMRLGPGDKLISLERIAGENGA